jgi:hypothetical protein
MFKTYIKESTEDYLSIFDLIKEKYGIIKQIKKLYGNIRCDHDNINSFKGSPKYIYGYFSCYNNKLTSFKYAPEYISSVFDCSSNNFNSLKYFPKFIGDNLYFKNNYDFSNYTFVTLEKNIRKISKVKGNIYL